MIDLHSHVLPGLDDGTRSIDEAVAMAAEMVDDGVVTLAATPHVREDFPTTPEAMQEALAELRSAVARAGLPLELLPGGEIAYHSLGDLTDERLATFGLGGNPRLLLLELPLFGLPLDLLPQVADLRERGFRIVIAHPERHRDLVQGTQLLHDVVRLGALLQVTASALDGRLGRGQRSAALALVEEGFAHLIASDAHRQGVRSSGMRRVPDVLGNDALAHWLTYDVPLALLAGETLPPRPSTPGRSRLGRR